MSQPRGSGPATVLLGATASTLKTYVLAPNLTGQAQRRPLSEYFAPVRLGPPEYDQRLPASTVAFPDFAGGLGKYLPDSRQEANRSWLLDGVDTRKPGIIALCPMWTSVNLSATPGNTNGCASFVFSDVNSTNRLYLAVGDTLYSTTGTAWATTVALSTTARYTYRLRNIVHSTGSATTEYLFWMRNEDTYRCSGDPTNSGNWSTVTVTGGVAVDVSIAPNTSTAVVFMATDGTISTHTLASAANVTTTIGSIGSGGHWIGTMQGILYGIDKKGLLWNYDPLQASGNQVRQQAATLPGITCGTVHQNAQLALSDGRRIQLWHPSRPSRDITPGSPDGLPASLAGTIRGLYTIGERLLAIMSLSSDASTVVMEFAGGGWHVLSKSKTGGWHGGGGSHVRQGTDAGFGFDPVNQRHWIAGEASGTFYTYYNTLPAGGDTPYVQELITGGDGFEETGAVETGWHSLGLRGLEGPLLQTRALGEFYDSYQGVDVYYKLNFDESSWTLLGQHSALVRARQWGSGAGVAARFVRFRLELGRATGPVVPGTSTKSPNAAFAVDFLKIPDQLDGRVFTIDMALTARRSKRTREQIYSDLKTLAEQKTLPVCSYADEGNVFVKLEAPRETTFIDTNGKKRGVLIVVANEVI